MIFYVVYAQQYIGVYTDFDVNDSNAMPADIFFFFSVVTVVYLRDISHRGRSLAVLKNVPADRRTLYFLCRRQKHGLQYKKKKGVFI